MKFAEYVFLTAGIYGILALAPMYFLQDYIGAQNPPPLTHPEFFYGFVGVALAWQLVFLMISRDPLKYRWLMLPAMLEKAAWGIPVLILYWRNAISPSLFGAGMIDLLWSVLFIVAFLKTARLNSD